MLHRPRRQGLETYARRSIFIAIGLVLILPGFVPAANANTNTCLVHLSSSYAYFSIRYGTYVKWADDLYGDSVHYGLGSDSHINFTDFSMGSPSNPSSTFGVVAQNGNVTITAIQANYVRFSGSAQAGRILYVTYYYPELPAQVYVTGSTNVSISSNSYYTDYGAWTNASLPAVYVNETSSSIVVKSASPTPVLQIDQEAENSPARGSCGGASATSFLPAAFLYGASFIGIAAATIATISVFRARRKRRRDGSG